MDGPWKHLFDCFSCRFSAGGKLFGTVPMKLFGRIFVKVSGEFSRECFGKLVLVPRTVWGHEKGPDFTLGWSIRFE